jgi:hypothetical protein
MLSSARCQAALPAADLDRRRRLGLMTLKCRSSRPVHIRSWCSTRAVVTHSIVGSARQ